LPDGETITADADGDLDLPVGSVIMKFFPLDGKLIETRLMVHHQDGGWAGYSYAWRDDQSDADYVPGGKTRDFGSQTWTYPSTSDCLNCHTAAAGGTLGLELGQLNGEFVYGSTNRIANQLKTWNHIGMFDADHDPDSSPKYPDPFGTAPMEERARAYLHTNCSQCHRPSTTLPVKFDMRFSTPLGMRQLCNVDPVRTDLGVDGAKRFVPGDPDHSLIWLRMTRRDANAMPPIATRIVDQQGSDLIKAWIESVSACP